MKSLDIKLLETPLYHFNATEEAPPHDQLFRLHNQIRYHIQTGNTFRLSALLDDENNIRLLFPADSFKRSYQSSIELLTIAKFSCIEGGCGLESTYVLYDTYTEYLLECHTMKELRTTCRNAMLTFTRNVFALSEFADAEYSPAINNCIRVIFEHLPEKLSLETIARDVHLSPKYLSALFVKETGHPITDFIQNVRVGEAKYLLTHSDLNYLEISTLLGFSSQSYFNSIFKKKTGMTPKEFRCQTPVIAPR